MMARAATPTELAKFRAGGDWSELYLAIHKPATVYSALVNVAPTSNNGVTQITYDGGSGTLANVLPGMTLYVGTSAGAYDLGMVRIRNAPSETVFYIGETSEIAWTDNAYLTVVDEFNLWARHIYSPSLTSIRMDWNITYTDQHKNPDPVPVMGPDAVLWLSGATVTFTPDASASWVVGGTIASYLWAAPGASATAGLDTATPTITYNAAGTYRVDCTVTASNNKTTTGHRNVFVYSAAAMPATALQIENCAGDYETGGWSFTATMYADAAIGDVRDRAKVILFAKDYYAGTLGSIGPLAGYENIIAAGWIDGESIEYDGNLGQVRFTVRGPQYWLDKMSGFPTGVKNKNNADPTTWLFIRDLTVDKGLWHFLHWRSTATAVMDIALTGDTRKIPATEASVGSLWQQLTAISEFSILAHPVCDRYGRLFVQVDTQYLAGADRAGIPVVQPLTGGDWTGQVGIERVTVPPVGLLDVSGIYYNGVTARNFFSKAPGRVFKRYGAPDSRDKLLFASQADANAMSGMLLARMNNGYPNVSLTLAENNRLIDITPRQVVTLSMAATDNPRGIVWTDKRLLPRRVEYRHEPESGALTVGLECEAETSGAPGETYIPPQPPRYNIPIPPIIPNIPIVPPNYPYFPPVVYPDPDDCRALGNIGAENGPFALTFSPVELNPGEDAVAWRPCYVRYMNATYPTTIWVGIEYGSALSDLLDDLTLTAEDATGNVLITGSTPAVDGAGIRWNLAPTPDGVDVSQFRLALAASSSAVLKNVTFDNGGSAYVLTLGAIEAGYSGAGAESVSWYDAITSIYNRAVTVRIPINAVVSNVFFKMQFDNGSPSNAVYIGVFLQDETFTAVRTVYSGVPSVTKNSWVTQSFSFDPTACAYVDITIMNSTGVGAPEPAGWYHKLDDIVISGSVAATITGAWLYNICAAGG